MEKYLEGEELGHEACHLLRDRTRLGLLGAVGTRVGAHVEDVDDSGHLVLGADREVDGDAALGELLLQLAERAEEVGPLTVEHVDEEQARDPELLGALPDARRPHLDAHHAAQDDERTLDDAQRGAGLSLKARIAGTSIRFSLRSCHSACVSESEIDIFRCCSSSSQSEVVEPASIVPSRFVSPAWKSNASTSDVLPVPRWPTTATLRILPGSKTGIRSFLLGSRGTDVNRNAVARDYADGTRAAPPRRAFKRRIAFVCSCETRDSVTPSTSPISRRVSSS